MITNIKMKPVFSEISKQVIMKTPSDLSSYQHVKNMYFVVSSVKNKLRVIYIYKT